MERLTPFARSAIGPRDAINYGIGSINSDETVEIDRDRASPMPVIGRCLQAHLCHLPIFSRNAKLEES